MHRPGVAKLEIWLNRPAGSCSRPTMERSKSLDGNPEVVNQQSLSTVTDEEIVTERKSPRRSFLAATGAALLAGGAVAFVVAGCGNDPDKAKSQPPAQAPTPAQDPDKAKTK
jgi:hypothetical protein